MVCPNVHSSAAQWQIDCSLVAATKRPLADSRRLCEPGSCDRSLRGVGIDAEQPGDPIQP